MQHQSTQVDTLSELELAILRGMAESLSNVQIARHLAMTPGTVKWHMKHLYAKLDVMGREQAVARAQELNLLVPQSAMDHDPTQAGERRSLRMINSLPQDISAGYIGYEDKLETLLGLIQQPARLITVTGRAGTGKTALVCKVLNTLRFGLDAIPAWDGIVSLSTTGVSINLDQILGDLGRLFNRDERAVFDAMIRSNELTWDQKIGGILDELAGMRIILFLDNLESLQHPDNGELLDAVLSLFLERVILQSASLVVIITASQPLPLSPSLRDAQHIISLDDGMAPESAVELLLACDPANETSLGQLAPEELAALAIRLGCSPRALHAFAGMLLENPDLPLLVVSRSLPDMQDDMTEWITAHALSHLSPESMHILQALAVFNQPVGYDALAFLLAPFLGNVNLRPRLARLTRANFLQYNRETQQYSLHPLDQLYCYLAIPHSPHGDDELARYFTRPHLHSRAAAFYHNRRLARLQWRQVSDLEPQFQEFYQLVAAGDCTRAAGVLLEIDRDHLWEWGQKNLLRQKYAQVAGRITDPILAHQTARRQAWLKVYEAPREAMLEFRQLLEEARLLGYRQGEADALDDLARNARRSARREALEMHRQALEIYRELGDRRGEAEALGGIGAVLAASMDGDMQESAALLEEAAAIQRELGNFARLSYLLSTLGIAYENLGQLTQAVKSLLEAVILSKEINHIELFVRAMIALARTYSLLGQHERAVAVSREAVDRARTITGAQMTNSLLIATSTHGLILGHSGDLLGGIAMVSQAISEAGAAPLGYIPVTYAYLSQLLFLYGDLQAARILVTPSYLAPEFYIHNAWLGVLFILSAEEKAAQSYLQKISAAMAATRNNAPARYAAALAQAGLAYLNHDSAAVQSAAILFRQARAQAELPLRVRFYHTCLERLASQPDGALLAPVLDVLAD